MFGARMVRGTFEMAYINIKHKHTNDRITVSNDLFATKVSLLL